MCIRDRVYLSDAPRDFIKENIFPLIDEQGKLFRPEAPALWYWSEPASGYSIEDCEQIVAKEMQTAKAD